MNIRDTLQTQLALPPHIRLNNADLDPAVGYILPVRIGDAVTPDTTLCTLYARNEADADKAEAAIRAAITIGSEPVARPPLCYAVVTAEGVQRTAGE